MSSTAKIPLNPVLRGVLCALIFIPLIVDFITGLFEYTSIDFPIGRLYRGLLWGTGLLYLFYRRKFGFVGLLILLWGIHLLIWSQFNEHFDLVYDFTFFLKVTYFFVLYDVLSDLAIKDKGKYILKYLKWYYKLIILIFCFSFVTGIGIPTYGQWGFGTRSFFGAQNDIGITILILFTLFIFNRKQFGVGWIWIFLGYFSLLISGTTTGMMISTLILVSYVLVKFFLSKISPLKKLGLGIAITVVVLGSSAAVYKLVSSTPYFVRKYENILDRGVRADVTSWAQQYYQDRGVGRNIFGEGISAFTKNFAYYAEGSKRQKFEKKGAFVERDLHDLRGAYGLFLLILLILFYGLIWLLAAARLQKFPNIFYLSVLLVITICYLHGYMAGHVFYSPTVGGILAAVIVLGSPGNYNSIKE